VSILSLVVVAVVPFLLLIMSRNTALLLPDASGPPPPPPPPLLGLLDKTQPHTHTHIVMTSHEREGPPRMFFGFSKEGEEGAMAVTCGAVLAHTHMRNDICREEREYAQE
jgi:hypothetical protein